MTRYAPAAEFGQHVVAVRQVLELAQVGSAMKPGRDTPPAPSAEPAHKQQVEVHDREEQEESNRDNQVRGRWMANGTGHLRGEHYAPTDKQHNPKHEVRVEAVNLERIDAAEIWPQPK